MARARVISLARLGQCAVGISVSIPRRTGSAVGRSFDPLRRKPGGVHARFRAPVREDLNPIHRFSPSYMTTNARNCSSFTGSACQGTRKQAQVSWFLAVSSVAGSANGRTLGLTRWRRRWRERRWKCQWIKRRNRGARWSPELPFAQCLRTAAGSMGPVPRSNADDAVGRAHWASRWERQLVVEYQSGILAPAEHRHQQR